MRVKFLNTCCGPYGCFVPGQIVDLPSNYCAGLLQVGAAEAIDPPPEPSFYGQPQEAEPYVGVAPPAPAKKGRKKKA